LSFLNTYVMDYGWITILTDTYIWHGYLNLYCLKPVSLFVHALSLSVHLELTNLNYSPLKLNFSSDNVILFFLHVSITLFVLLCYYHLTTLYWTCLGNCFPNSTMTSTRYQTLSHLCFWPRAKQCLPYIDSS